jgi:cytidylate kinase
VARFKSISSVEALDRIREVDKSRKQFYRRNFDRDANDPGIFDLVLNTGMLTPEACADIVLLAFKARFGDKH